MELVHARVVLTWVVLQQVQHTQHLTVGELCDCNPMQHFVCHGCHHVTSSSPTTQQNPNHQSTKHCQKTNPYYPPMYHDHERDHDCAHEPSKWYCVSRTVLTFWIHIVDSLIHFHENCNAFLLHVPLTAKWFDVDSATCNKCMLKRVHVICARSLLKKPSCNCRSWQKRLHWTLLKCFASDS